MKTPELSKQSRLILESLAGGRSYDQILSEELAINYYEIFQAIAEVLVIAKQASRGATNHHRIQKIKKSRPRAYEKWTPEEEETLNDLFRSGRFIGDIAKILQRQPSAIRSRLSKLNLMINATSWSSKMTDSA